MEKDFDQLQAQVRKHQLTIEGLEDQFFADRQAVEEARYDLEDRRKALDNLYEELHDSVFQYLRQEDVENFDAYRRLNDIIGEYAWTTEEEYRKERHRLDEREEEIYTVYHRERNKLEDAIDDLKKEQRRIIYGY